MKKLAFVLAVLVLTGCSVRTGQSHNAPASGPPAPAAGNAAATSSFVLPSLQDLSGASIQLNGKSPNPPALRVGYSDQRAVIAQILDLIAAAEPVPGMATRYSGDSPVVVLHLTQGGGIAVALAYQCASAPNSSAPTDCHRVPDQVTLFPSANAQPLLLQSHALAAWLEGGWEHNWPVASPPDRVTVQITVKGGDTPAMPPIGDAEVTFESESGTRYQVKSDSGGSAELTVPVAPVVTSTGDKRCASYRVTVAAEAYKTEVIDRVFISPWAGTVYFHPSLAKGDGIWHVTETGDKCIPDQQPGP